VSACEPEPVAAGHDLDDFAQVVHCTDGSAFAERDGVWYYRPCPDAAFAPLTYMENVLTSLIEAAPGGGATLDWGERLDAHSDLRSLDEVVEPPSEPPDGWGEGVVTVEGRPVRPLRRSPVRERRPTTASAAASVMRPPARAARRGPSRERRARRSGASSGSRDGPSDESEGDGEGPPSPASTEVGHERQGRAPTNSRSANTKCPGWRVGDHGIDTVAFGCYDPDAARALREFARERRKDPRTGLRQREDWKGSFMRLALPVNGTTVGVYPASGLVTIEARLAVVLAGHAEDHRLIPADRLAEGAERAMAAVARLGIALAAPLTVRRLDLAAELCFRVGTDGVSFLNACQRGLHLPRLRQVPYYAVGEARLESIVWATEKGRQTRSRLYDAGTHHKTGRPGRRLRWEREHRWSGSGSPTPEQVMALDLAAMYAAPLRGWLRESKPMRVCSPSTAIALLFNEARAGKRTRRSAESLSAKINSVAHGADLLAPHDRRRRVKALRDAGIALDRSGDVQTGFLDIREQASALVAAWEAV
jgi:hypothetical protein